MNRRSDEIFDEMLVLRVQAGDDVALTQLIVRWQPRLVQRAHQLTGRDDVAADLAQETWLVIIRRLYRLRDSGAFRSWAFRIIHNKSVDWVRQQKRRREHAESFVDRQSSSHSGATEGPPEDEVLGLRMAIRQLGPEQQSLLRMYYTDALSLKEIAFITDAPIGTLKYRLFAIRKQLKRIIERTPS